MTGKTHKVWKVVVATAFFFMLNWLCAEDFEPLRFKGLWVVRESMVDRAEIEAALNFAYESGFNHVFVQIRGRGDAYYNSLLIPRSSRIREQDFDPLAYAISRGHELGLNIHAWVTTYLLWSARTPPEIKNHVYRMYPEWLEVDAEGNAQVDVDLSAPRNSTFEGIFLSPVHPEVNGYLQAVFTEILLKYDIDGLHLDYCRFPDLDYGYNAEGLGVFQSRYGFDPREIHAFAAQQDAAHSSDEINRKLEIWSKYRQQKISDLMTAMHAVITLSGKEALLTAAVKPDARVARYKYGQDWTQWLRKGIIDYAFPMNYTPEMDTYIENINIMTDSLSHQLQKRVVMGVATYNQDAQATADKIRLARIYGFQGVCIFSYDAHKTNLTHFNPILKMMGP
ncbi:glycoside hydrolase family 10 protein [Candidatus Neomarinimicrobiota bacterium]